MGRKKSKHEATALPFRESKGGRILEVRVQPRSSKASIDGVEGDVLRVRLTAPPADGAANAQLIKLLSDELGVRKSGIEIVKGLSSRNKIVRISG